MLPKTFPLWLAVYKSFTRGEAGPFKQLQDRLHSSGACLWARRAQLTAKVIYA
ncbi:hypothetical protein EGJ52_22850 [Pseudomonas luteola]|nr:hypothetical protein EGJ52_22850 [Pseudomonas luteola]